ncbi:MAG TPA: hybrid sensor histidine kinase/response regulator [Burkholderiales bacterium]|nr:hybrid sensor histidine kinase/response regulator [Burkholderiales bacterium]
MHPAIRDRLARARAGDAMELEQAKLRLTIVAAAELYFLVSYLLDRVLDDGELLVLAIIASVFALAVAHLGWMLLRPGANHVRRRAAVVLDMGATTAGMVLGAETGSMLYGVYLWVAIGNGFRYGRWYLHFAQALALAGFFLVILLTPFWQQHSVLSASLVLVLLAVPGYVSVLVARLQAASQRLQELRGEAEAANVAKTKFLAAASHDLRQPMQALSMYASVLEQRPSDAGTQRVVHGIKLSVTNLEQMFDSLLDISKIESGVVKPNIVAFPLQPLIEQVAEAERPIAAHKSLELRVIPTSASVRSDPVLLERMLRNLVTNAIRYTQRGKIAIGCRRLCGGWLRLDVVDTGIGIALEEQARIFDEYYQLSGSSAQGLGLGLPIVKSLGELLGHKVGVRSALGRGSVFSIELEQAFDAPAASPAHPASAAAPLGRLKVVLVDDDVEIRESVRLLVEGWGCRYVAGATLNEVEDELHAQQLTPDAVIADYRLAGSMSGLQVIEHLRAEFGAGLPALIITGTANPSYLQSRAGGIPFAIKPVAPGKLRAFLTQAMRAA